MYLFTDKKFEVAVSVVLLHEGGLTNNPNDPGGLTDFGISLRFLRAAGIDGNMNRSDHIGPEDIRALTPTKAKSIYYTYFYIKYNINYIQSQMLTNSLLDMAVLMGGQEAIWLLQIPVNKLVEGKVNIDGLLGQKTLALVNCANSEQLNFNFKDQCRTHFLELVAKNPKLKGFLDGWNNRVNSL